MDVTSFVANLKAEDLLALKEVLGIRKARPKKEQSPEFIAAKAALDAFVAENEELVAEYDDLKEKLRGTKAVRKVLSTRQYNLDEESKVVTVRDSGEVVCVYGEEGWQSKMRNMTFTVGQCAAVSKKMRAVQAGS